MPFGDVCMPRMSPLCVVVLVVVVLAVTGCNTTANDSSKSLDSVQTEKLAYGPEVQLVGAIRKETFSGQLNYEDIAKKDVTENYWILHLSRPIDVAEDPEYPIPDENKPQMNVRDVQLNLDYNAYRQFLNKKVVVTGELTQGFTVHHKTAILIDVLDIQSAE